MEWVMAALAMGCAFFTFQVVMDHIKYRSMIRPRLEQLDQAQTELEGRLTEARRAVEERRGELDPIRTEVEQLEAERADLERRMEAERLRPPPPSDQQASP